MGTDGTWRPARYLMDLNWPKNYKKLEAGEEHDIWVNQGWREATVLAVLGPEAILEYVMPSGRSALRRVSVWYHKGSDPGTPYKNVSYRTIPKAFLLEIVRNDVWWWASPQQVPDLHMSPKEAFLARWPDEAWRFAEPVTPVQMQQTQRTNAKVRERIGR